MRSRTHEIEDAWSREYHRRVDIDPMAYSRSLPPVYKSIIFDGLQSDRVSIPAVITPAYYRPIGRVVRSHMP